MYSILIFLCLAYTVVAVLLIIGAMLHLKRKKQEAYVKLKNTTLVVAFRNEEQRIALLLDALNQQKKLPKKILFVNDHSEDRSKDYILNHLKIDKSIYEIIDLPLEIEGKKGAIRYGMSFVKTEFYLTQDADVYYDENYFLNLERLPKADLYILPVLMTYKNTKEAFFVMDHQMINAVNWALSSIFPLTASGANMLVRKADFMALTYLNYSEHIASGDDQFLLRDFRLAKKDIYMTGNLALSVNTPAPTTFLDLLKQRLRWIGKNIEVGDVLENICGGVATFMNLGFFIIMFVYCLKGLFISALLVFLYKTTMDMIFYTFHFKHQKRLTLLQYLPIMEFIYPFYTLLIIVLLPFYKPKWKGRNLTK